MTFSKHTFMLGSTHGPVVVLTSVQEETARNLRQPLGRKRDIAELTRISNPISSLAILKTSSQLSSRENSPGMSA